MIYRLTVHPSSIAETRSPSSSNLRIRSSIRRIWLGSIAYSLSVSWSARADFSNFETSTFSKHVLVYCACVVKSKMPRVRAQKRVGLYACNCAKCKKKYRYSYSTVCRHRNIYGTEAGETDICAPDFK